MKILHLLNSSSYSGAENVAITIIKNMSKNYHAAYASRDGDIKRILLKEKIDYYPIKRMTPKEVKQIIKDYKPDIIHAHDFTASVVAALTKTKIPIISHLHNNTPWLKKYHLYSFIYLISTFRFKKILGVSQSIFDEYVFSKYIKDKIEVISNPINVKNIKLKSNYGIKKQYDIIFIGRLTKPKNPLKFIDLIAQVKKDLPDIRVAMIGNGELHTECKNKINHLSLNNNIELLGFLDNPYGILSQCKVLCMTSEWEGFGLVAVEALSLGIPVVATPVGGLSGIINSSCGLLTFDDQIYIDEVKRIILDKKYWEKKSKSALKRANELDNLKEYISIIDNIYKNIIT